MGLDFLNNFSCKQEILEQRRTFLECQQKVAPKRIIPSAICICTLLPVPPCSAVTRSSIDIEAIVFHFLADFTLKDYVYLNVDSIKYNEILMYFYSSQEHVNYRI